MAAALLYEDDLSAAIGDQLAGAGAALSGLTLARTLQATCGGSSLQRMPDAASALCAPVGLQAASEQRAARPSSARAADATQTVERRMSATAACAAARPRTATAARPATSHAARGGGAALDPWAQGHTGLMGHAAHSHAACPMHTQSVRLRGHHRVANAPQLHRTDPQQAEAATSRPQHKRALQAELRRKHAAGSRSCSSERLGSDASATPSISGCTTSDDGSGSCGHRRPPHRRFAQTMLTHATTSDAQPQAAAPRASGRSLIDHNRSAQPRMPRHPMRRSLTSGFATPQSHGAATGIRAYSQDNSALFAQLRASIDCSGGARSAQNLHRCASHTTHHAAMYAVGTTIDGQRLSVQPQVHAPALRRWFMQVCSASTAATDLYSERLNAANKHRRNINGSLLCSSSASARAAESRCKQYSPGPGAYLQQTRPPGTAGHALPGFSICSRGPDWMQATLAASASPGPAYRPAAMARPATTPARVAIGKADRLARYSCHSGKASNDPHWAPPAKYDVVRPLSSLHSFISPRHCQRLLVAPARYPRQFQAKSVWCVQLCDRQGRLVAPGGAALAHRFTDARRAGPQDCLTASTAVARVPYAFAGQARENLTVFSPGPKYNPEPTPDASPIRARSAKHSLAARGVTAWDAMHKAAAATPGAGGRLVQLTAQCNVTFDVRIFSDFLCITLGGRS